MDYKKGSPGPKVQKQTTTSSGPQPAGREPEPSELLMRKVSSPADRLTPADVIQLSRQIGNRATAQLLRKQAASRTPSDEQPSTPAPPRPVSIPPAPDPPSLQREFTGDLAEMDNDEILEKLREQYVGDKPVSMFNITGKRNIKSKQFATLDQLAADLGLRKKGPSGPPSPTSSGGITSPVKPPATGISTPSQPVVTGGGTKPPATGISTPSQPVVTGGGTKPPATGIGTPSQPVVTGGGTKPPASGINTPSQPPATAKEPAAAKMPAPETEKPSGPSPAPAKKQADILKDPELRLEHRGEKVYIKPGKLFAKVIGTEVGEPDTSFKEAQEVNEEKKGVQRVSTIVRSGSQLYEYKTGVIGKSTGSYSDPHPVKKVRDNVKRVSKEVAGGVIIYNYDGNKIGGGLRYANPITVSEVQVGVKNGNETGSIVKYDTNQYWVKTSDIIKKEETGVVVKDKQADFWVLKDGIDETVETGSFVKNGNEKYWVNKDYLETKKAEYVKKTDPLFPVPPKPEDVLQGELGDCFLMAALSSIVRQNPGFPGKLLTDNNDGTVTVHFFQVSDSSTGYYTSGKDKGQYASSGKFKATPRDVTINKSVAEAQGKALYAQKFLWVQLVEKAYAAGGFPKGLLSGSFEELSAGGKSKQAFEVFLGQEASFTNLKHREGTKDKDVKVIILEEMAAALKEGQVVTASTRSFTAQEKLAAKNEGTGHSAGESKLNGIVSDHAYSVISVDEKAKSLKLRNPWGEYGRTLAGTAVKEGGGIVEISIADFMNWYDSVHYSGKAAKLKQ